MNRSSLLIPLATGLLLAACSRDEPPSPSSRGEPANVNHYPYVIRLHFHLYALDQPLTLPPNASRPAVESALKSHILATGELIGTYERN